MFAGIGLGPVRGAVTMDFRVATNETVGEVLTLEFAVTSGGTVTVDATGSSGTGADQLDGTLSGTVSDGFNGTFRVTVTATGGSGVAEDLAIGAEGIGVKGNSPRRVDFGNSDSVSEALTFVVDVTTMTPAKTFDFLGYLYTNARNASSGDSVEDFAGASQGWASGENPVSVSFDSGSFRLGGFGVGTVRFRAAPSGAGYTVGTITFDIRDVPAAVAAEPVMTRGESVNGGANYEFTWKSSFGQQFDIFGASDLSTWTMIDEGVPASAGDETGYAVDPGANDRYFFQVGLKSERIPKPNIVMLFADDLGYGDLACYGHPYAKTPNLDALAAQGTLFQKFNVTGTTCNPSRTGILTSRHPNSFPLNTSDHGFDQASQGFVDRITIMELLDNAGYETGHFGKWHIGPVETNGTYGIDEIIVSGGGRNDPRGRDEDIYENAIAFIEANKDVPFYVNVMGRVTHNPIDPRPELVVSAGFSSLVVNRNDFVGQQIQDSFDAVVAATAGDQSIHTSMANYLTEVYYLDEFVGELLAKLDEHGLTDNTLVMFSSDQGAALVKDEAANPHKTNTVGYSGGLRGQKHDQYEGGIRSPFILRWPGYVPAGKVNTESIISALDWLPTLCRIVDIPINPTDFHGEDVLDIWMGSDRSRRGPQFWGSSLKKDDWRIYFSGTTAVELYDLSTDLGETTNLVNSRRDMVNELTPLWEVWRGRLP
ncbi:MAG: sulfatase-like hydrolase/transferase [Verrucomicrobiota bacterium]